MTGSIVMTVIGTMALTLAATLLLLRVRVKGRLPVLALARRWTHLKAGSAGLAITALCAIAALNFIKSVSPASEGAHLFADVPSMLASGDERTARALESLRAYAGKIEEKRQSIAALGTDGSADNAQQNLPDVDTMITRLAARLEKEPNDAKGWKILGWSYLNTGKPQDAVKAYETALKLQPADEDMKKGLEAAKAVPAGATQREDTGAAPGPSAEDIKAAEGLSGTQRDDMIRGMVDRLAARLESSPNDEDGWVRLMRSRVTLGETEGARQALSKALSAFSQDSSAKERLTSSARALGLEISQP